MSPAAARWGEDVRARRAADPLAALLLLVPSRLLGVHLRRRLAREQGGVLNLHALTLPDLADRVAGLPLALQGRRPLPPVADRLVVARAIRAGIPAAGGYFSAVAALPNFPDALAATLLDLKKAGVSPDALEASAPPDAKIRELAACYRAAEAALAEHGYYDTSDLLVEAARLLEEDPGRLGAAAVHVYGFLELNPLEARLVAACRRAASVTEYPAEAAGSPLPPPAAIEIVAAPGEEREVREVARAILAHAARGGRFEEVGVLLRQPGVYRAAVRDVFGAAGIPYTWGVAPALRETRAGRTLWLLAEARRTDFARGAVMELLSLADLPPGPGVSPAEWERLSRQAGIVRGAREWLARLGRLDRRLHAAARDGDRAGDEGADEREITRGRDRDALAALQRVVTTVVRGLSRLPPEGPIGELARRLGSCVRRLVAPSVEADQVLGALASLGALAPLEARVSQEELWTLLEAALARPADPGPEERAGKVFVGELGQSLGLGFPLTVLPGLVEGGFPAPLRQDPLLLDDERRRLAGLPLSTTERALERVRFRAALAGPRRLLLTYPRVDAASGRPRVPSFFLLDLLAEVTGRRHDFTGLEAFAGFRAVPLGPAPPAAAALPLDEREWLITRGLAARGAPERLLAALPGVAAAHRAIEERERSPRLTAFDGLLARGVPPGEAPLAPTWLERYATCPFGYFLGHVLGVRPVEEPERVLAISAADRGTVVHAALEGTYRRLGEAGELPVTAARLDRALAALDAALDEVCEAAERQGVTGLPALWAGERARLRAALRAALEAEARDRDEGERVPALLEVPFGMEWLDPAAPPLAYVSADGGTALRLRGKVDRVDLSRDGSRARVIDYKTGRVREGKGRDRLAHGRALQLPVYRLAAEALLAARGLAASVEEAQYYHVIGPDAASRVRFSRAGWAERRADFDRVLAIVTEGIRAGRFFARPEACSGRHPCDFDLACGAERARWAEAKAADPAVLRHAELEAIP